MSMVFTMKCQLGDGLIPGVCAHCEKAVFESLATLDDCYNVWVGKCPHCNAHNFLSMESLRGYSSQGMHLVLPYDEERNENDLPSDTPTRGPHPSGKAECHGTMLGEIAHQLREQNKPERPPGGSGFEAEHRPHEPCAAGAATWESEQDTEDGDD